jgi:hypothetical protein
MIQDTPFMFKYSIVSTLFSRHGKPQASKLDGTTGDNVPCPMLGIHLEVFKQ